MANNLTGIVDNALDKNKDGPSTEKSSVHSEPQTLVSKSEIDTSNARSRTRPTTPQSGTVNNHVSWNKPNSPSMRTGPPRSLSYNYSPSHTPLASRKNSRNDGQDLDQDFTFGLASAKFRGVLEGLAPSASGTQSDKKGKKRESKLLDESWNPIKWLTDTPKTSPKDEQNGFDFENKGEKDKGGEGEQEPPNTAQSGAVTPHSASRRNSAGLSSPGRPGAQKWGRLRSLLNANQPEKKPVQQGNVAVKQDVNITDELITGGLSTLMLRLWFERDEKDHRRIPVLFHRLRIRVSDSLHATKGNKAVFRIECEYANGAARWVVYRQLRDFISLHGHYTVSNAYNRTKDKLPEFPKTSLPYFKFLNRESKEKGGRVHHADFARMQRELLENYLIDLIRAVMFHPSTNRLAGFLEISALSIAFSNTGGAQYKAGYIQVEASGKGGGFGRKSASWKEKKDVRWAAVRESYLVVLEEPGELTVWDVFLLDCDFTIERPKRYYRQGLSLLQPDGGSEKGGKSSHKRHDGDTIRSDTRAHDRKDSIRRSLSRIIHPRKAAHGAFPEDDASSSSSSSSSSGSSVTSRPSTPMLDPSTNTNPIMARTEEEHREEEEGTGAGEHWHPNQRKREGEVSQHTFYLINSQMKLKVTAKNKRQMEQYITALEKIAATSHYSGTNRFDSFAPIRLNVACQWLVDGRDYFWNLSRAILLAKECVYIHDWWLSPELQMRRPNKDRYRLDRLLERKAKEGVKIYIILYQEVSNKTTPTDSNYAKQKLTSLHHNIMVQRSPSHFQTGTFYWAHHEKMCVIDQAIAFMGGLDLCFGRWDTAQHVLTDEPDAVDERSEIWPGKDYSNPRVTDFYKLNEPQEDMYDRSKVPRMPWHDVGMQIVGQPARDLARHFVQRWNYLLRIKNHSRVMPFLLPPPEFRPGELTQMGLTGTCELQICRSAGPWSLGTPNRIEHSIQNAYLKAIQMSEHFVYMENQFFITSTNVNDVRIENKIGDALVHRIIRAHKDGTPWKCCIMIPLIPGFTFPVDHTDASAIRIILECQNRTISRGPNSIFSRLRKEGIDPDEYISVFSLRNWAKLRGDVLTTEQVYIHGKVCIVDDRLAIIGSANINERSQRGDRDSELAAIIRDTDMIDGTMAGKPYKVGRFAHTLRMRLMREHVGVDVDALDEEDLMANEPVKPEHEQEEWDPENEQQRGLEGGVTRVTKSNQRSPTMNLIHTGTDGLSHMAHGTNEAMGHIAGKALGKMGIVTKTTGARMGDVADLEEERTTYTREGKQVPGFASAVVPTLEEKTIIEHRPFSSADGSPIADTIKDSNNVGNGAPPEATTSKGDKYGAPADASRSRETDDQPPHARSDVNDAEGEELQAPNARSLLRRHLNAKSGSKMWTIPTPRPNVDPYGFEDPVADSFWKDVWVASAAHNTEIFRKVFHAIPDDLITTWKQYKEFVVHHERLNKPSKDSPNPEPVARMPSETADEGAPGKDGENFAPTPEENGTSKEGSSQEDSSDPQQEKQESAPAAGLEREPTKSRKERGPEPFEKWEKEEMEKLLGELNGHLVLFPNRFLEGEDVANNFLFNADRLLPMPIYD